MYINEDSRLGAEARLSSERTKRRTTMFRYLPIFAALATSLISSALIPSLKADEWDKKTNITVSKSFAVEETVFPAGHYVLKLQNSLLNRDVVQIYNEEGTRIIATILAIPALRQEATDGPKLSFYETPAEQPAALHTWFFAGDTSGVEFLQPKHATPAGVSTATN
jgi:hypothetical protein